MRVALYPGSFNPMHEGHLDVLKQTHKLFDKVLIIIAVNPEKNDPFSANASKRMQENELRRRMNDIRAQIEPFGNVDVTWSDKLLSETIQILEEESSDNQVEAVIRGLRNTKDFEDEKTLKYLYEDTGVKASILHVISGREYTHVSSSAKRGLKLFGK